jgi:hypothetical protein
MKTKDRLQVLMNLSLPLALPYRAKKNCGRFILPQYKIDFSILNHLKPSFGWCKSKHFSFIENFYKKKLELNTVPQQPREK